MSLISNISVKTQSILQCWGRFGILRTSSFQNCPWICILSKIWRIYLGFYIAKGPVGHHCMSIIELVSDQKGYIQFISKEEWNGVPKSLRNVTKWPCYKLGKLETFLSNCKGHLLHLHYQKKTAVKGSSHSQ